MGLRYSLFLSFVTVLLTFINEKSIFCDAFSHSFFLRTNKHMNFPTCIRNERQIFPLAVHTDEKGNSLETSREKNRESYNSHSSQHPYNPLDKEKTPKCFEDAWIRNDIELGKDAMDMERKIKNNEAIIGPSHVIIYDTSLRDGTQGESVSVSCDDKLKIATHLASFNIDFIECGWPGSNPKDAEFFIRAQIELDSHTKDKLVAFGSTRRKNVRACDDSQIKALLDSKAPTVCIVAKGNLWQVTDIIRASPKENLEMISDSVKYLTEMGLRVFVDLEHFFDGYKLDRDYSLKCCASAVESGAKGLVLCDTNGGSMPWEVEEITRVVTKHFGGENGVTVGIHAHNDCGMAVANSLSSIRGGSGLVQGTINGIGERTGNADLCSIIPTLLLHMESKVSCKSNLKFISKLSRFVDETLNRSHNSAAPFVGTSAFAHKGGLHVSAMKRNPLSYQHVDPDLVGNEMRVLISELSGRQNIM